MTEPLNPFRRKTAVRRRRENQAQTGRALRQIELEYMGRGFDPKTVEEKAKSDYALGEALRRKFRFKGLGSLRGGNTEL